MARKLTLKYAEIQRVAAERKKKRQEIFKTVLTLVEDDMDLLKDISIECLNESVGDEWKLFATNCYKEIDHFERDFIALIATELKDNFKNLYYELPNDIQEKIDAE